MVQGRWVVLFSVLLALFLRQEIVLNRPSIFHVVFLGLAYNGALHIWLSSHPPGPRLSLLTLAADLLLVTWLVYLSGGINSPFYSVFYLVVIAAAVQRGIAGGLWTALASFVLIMVIEVITPSGRLRLANIDRVLSSLPYSFLVAFAAGYMSRQLSREADRRRQAEVQARTLELEQQRTHLEMEIAQAVQAALLPAEPPRVPGVDIAAKTVPAREIGGDLLDFAYDLTGVVTAAVIDVSGKGIPAALALSGLKSSLDSSHGLGLSDALAALNQYMISHTPEEMFATTAICTLNSSSRKLRAASAGHEPILLVKATGAVQLVTTGGLPLGIASDVNYPVTELDVEVGDIIVLYTDGVTEAQCDGRALGVEGLADIVVKNRAAHAQAVLDAVFDKLAADCSSSDDATVVILKLTDLFHGTPSSAPVT